jgi:TRAP-type uncharacterized transport system substrate-binding protein
MEITVFTWPVGTFAYVHNHKLAEMINKKSSWLRAHIIAYSTPTEGIMNMQQMKTKSIASVGTDGPAAIKGIAPYPKPMLTIKAIGNIANVCNPFATLDPNVKSWADLKGKTVSSTSPAAASTHIIKAAFERCGVKPEEYKITYMSYQKGVDTLKAGMLGACSAGGSYYPSKKLYMPNPATAELIASKPTYFVPVEAEDVAKVIAEKDLFGIGHFSLPPGGIKGSNQPVSGYSLSTGFYCDEALDARIIIEFLKIWYEDFDNLKVGLPALAYLNEEDMGNMMLPQEYWHPAALRFMQEHKIPIR